MTTMTTTRNKGKNEPLTHSQCANICTICPVYYRRYAALLICVKRTFSHCYVVESDVNHDFIKLEYGFTPSPKNNCSLSSSCVCASVCGSDNLFRLANSIIGSFIWLFFLLCVVRSSFFLRHCTSAFTTWFFILRHTFVSVLHPSTFINNT